MESKICPNCKSEIKEGFFSNQALSIPEVTLINDFGTGAASGYCYKCAAAFIIPALRKYRAELEIQKNIIQGLINHIPILSIQNPLNWDYIAIGLVTSQSVLGTGLLSEFTSSFTDLFGTQSGAYNKKLIEGETFCKNMLRKNALELGANAIIGADVDYSEAGSLKGMLMVCIAGTAIKLKNPEVIGADPKKIIMLMEANDWFIKYKDLPK